MEELNVKVNGQTYKAVFEDKEFMRLASTKDNEAVGTDEPNESVWGVWFPYKGDVSEYPADWAKNGFSLFIGYAIKKDGTRSNRRRMPPQLWGDDFVIDEF